MARRSLSRRAWNHLKRRKLLYGGGAAVLGAGAAGTAAWLARSPAHNWVATEGPDWTWYGRPVLHYSDLEPVRPLTLGSAFPAKLRSRVGGEPSKNGRYRDDLLTAENHALVFESVGALKKHFGRRFKISVD